MNKKGTVAYIWASAIVILCVMKAIGALDALVAWVLSLPFYLLNAWAFWLTVLNTILLLGLWVYVRRRLQWFKLAVQPLMNHPPKTEAKPKKPKRIVQKKQEPKAESKLKKGDFNHV